MANTHSNLTSLFTDIADAIRSKTGGTETIVADQFPEAIAAISSQPETAIRSASSSSLGYTMTVSALKGCNGFLASLYNAGDTAGAPAGQMASAFYNGTTLTYTYLTSGSMSSAITVRTGTGTFDPTTGKITTTSSGPWIPGQWGYRIVYW
jgi:hypothetical protein